MQHTMHAGRETLRGYSLRDTAAVAGAMVVALLVGLVVVSYTGVLGLGTAGVVGWLGRGSARAAARRGRREVGRRVDGVTRDEVVRWMAGAG